MIKNIFKMIAFTVVGMVLASFVVAQKQPNPSPLADKYMISAKAGGVNYTEGETTLTGQNGRNGILLARDEIEVGDRVSTGPSGKVEVLLNPGSYMRIGANSEFEFKTTSLDDLHIRIDRGIALFEVFAANEFRVTIETPKGAVALIETGVYKVDVNSDGGATISVYDGAAQIGDVNLTIIKSGRTAAIARNNITISKFDRGNKGELGDWSKTRSKDLAKMTNSLKNQDMRNSLLSSFNSGSWNMFNSFGLWIYNPYSRFYCFLPFGQGWYSPYGYGYGTDVWWFNLPPQPRYTDPNSGPRGPRNPPIIVNDPTTKDGAGRQGGVRQSPDAEPVFKSFERSREPRQPVYDPGSQNDTYRPGRREMPPITVSPPIIATPPASETTKGTRKDN